MKKKINENKVSCIGTEYLSDSGVYYFRFYDIGGVVSLPLYYFRETITGYVKVVNDGGISTFYVSVSDGKLGYPEVLVDDLKTDNVLDDYHLVYPAYATNCKFVKYSKTNK